LRRKSARSAKICARPREENVIIEPAIRFFANMVRRAGRGESPAYRHHPFRHISAFSEQGGAERAGCMSTSIWWLEKALGRD